jgi:glucokinase
VVAHQPGFEIEDAMPADYAIGVDIGGTKCAFALIDRAGSLLESHQVPTTAQRDSREILDDIASGINSFLDRYPGRVSGIGIGTPGYIVPESGVVLGAVNLGWKELDLKKEIRSRLEGNLPIRIRKDADASLIGEYAFGAARGKKEILYVCVGSGLGGAMMSGGRLLTGASGMTVDIGHVFLYPNGRRCACGMVGCAETVVSGPGLIAEVYQLNTGMRQSARFFREKPLTPAEILDAARSGDEVALQACVNLATGLGQILAMCISILNPEIIVLAGGLMLAARDIIEPYALQEMQRHSLPHCRRDLKIVMSGLACSAIGAASLVWYDGV